MSNNAKFVIGNLWIMAMAYLTYWLIGKWNARHAA